MASPLGSTLTHAFLFHYEKIWLNKYSPLFKHVIYRCYIDDIYVLFKLLVEFLLHNGFLFDTYKIDSAHTLLFQFFFKICSSMENFHIDVEHLRSIFKFNNYPVSTIDQSIKKCIEK